MLPLFALGGYFFGQFLIFFAKEEIINGHFYIQYFARFLFLFLLTFIFGYLGFLFGIVVSMILHRYESFVYAGISGLLAGLHPLPSVVSLCFLLGFPIGSLTKGKEFFSCVFLFFLGLLPWGLSYL